jgi:uncharacterized protein YgbK (DUF1537 family)
MLGIGEQTSGRTQAELLKELAELAASRIETASINTLLMEGGATAAAIAARIGWTRFEVVATAPAGVGVLRPIASRSPLVLVKPGSYSWPPEIWNALCQCAAGR